jgi:RNA polymerase-binding transcription factor DksA
MATKKKVTAKPVAKKPAKPVKSAPKKVVKAAPVKKTATKKAAKPAPKKVAKPAPKSVKPVKKAPAKVVATKKAPVKKSVKPAPKPVVSKKAPVKKSVKPVTKPMTKKTETKKVTPKVVAAKVVEKKPTVPVKAKDIKVPAPKPVVIPKIATKTVRKYQPEFTKSVLDKSAKEENLPTQRYSDGELAEFRELILRKLESAKKELTYLHGLITRKDEMGGDEADNRYMTMEDGSLSMEREQLSQMASRQVTFIDHLEKAMMRIENKTYGICRVTGKLIDKARLRAVPHATLSIEAKMGSAK